MSQSFFGVILWDIDGTLLRVNRPNSISPHQMALQKKGYDLQTSKIELSGLTDYEVLLALIRENGIKVDRKSLFGAFKDLDEESKILDKISSFNLCLGINNTLESLSTIGWINGIVTGNTISRLNSKLSNALIKNCFQSEFVFGCQFGDSRVDIIERAKKLLLERKYPIFLIIGDTPLDILAAKSANLRVISVATGCFSMAQLASYKPDLLIEDLIVGKNSFFKFLDELIS
jgi:phosphoglycolate phosphatase